MSDTTERPSERAMRLAKAEQQRQLAGREPFDCTVNLAGDLYHFVEDYDPSNRMPFNVASCYVYLDDTIAFDCPLRIVASGNVEHDNAVRTALCQAHESGRGAGITTGEFNAMHRLRQNVRQILGLDSMDALNGSLREIASSLEFIARQQR